MNLVCDCFGLYLIEGICPTNSTRENLGGQRVPSLNRIRTSLRDELLVNRNSIFNESGSDEGTCPRNKTRLGYGLKCSHRKQNKNFMVSLATVTEKRMRHGQSRG